MTDLEREHRNICERYGADYHPLDLNSKLGIADNIFSDVLPLNGLRHPEEKQTCGWYLWAGEELSKAPDFFKPMHVFHLLEHCPKLIKYLGLPPGWRFLVGARYEDVWFDATLLEVQGR